MSVPVIAELRAYIKYNGQIDRFIFYKKPI